MLKHTGKEGSDLAQYMESEPFTTKQKLVTVEKAVRDLGMASTVTLDEGIGRTVEWMRAAYGLRQSALV